MFIVSKKAYYVRLKNGQKYRIPNGFIGEIPDEVAKDPIIGLAIKDGSIQTPESKKDRVIDKATEDAAEKVLEGQKAKEEAKAKEDDAKAKAKATKK